MEQEKIIFSLSANKRLANEVSSLLNIPLGIAEIEHFEDGELIVRCKSDVKNKTVYIIQSTSAPATQHIFEILIFADALKTGGAKEIILVIPYFGYSRQDRIAKEGEPVSARVVANAFESNGIKKIITVDVHNPVIEEFFNIEFVNLSPSKLFADTLKQKGLDNNVVIVTPDHGSNSRANELSKYLNNASIAFIEKHRPAPNKSKVISIQGEFEGKSCVIIDDIIDTGGTINNATEVLLSKGAKEVYVVATHAVCRENVLDKRIKEIIVTDSIEKEIDGIDFVSLSKDIADAIK